MTNVRLKEVASKATDTDFYNQFFTASNVTAVIGYFGQAVSALTEFHLFFTSTGGVYSPFFQQDNILPILAGLIAIYLFEVLGVRVYLVRIIRQIVNKDFGTWERWVLFGFNMLFVLALCGANLVSSYLGQNMTFAAKTNVTTTDKTHKLELEKTAKIEQQTSIYKQDIRERTKTYNKDVELTTLRYDTDIKELKNSRYTHRENKSKYDNYTAQIDKKLASKQAELTDLKTDFDNSKKEITATFNDYISTLKSSYDKRINDISKTENANIDLWLIVQKYTLPLLIVFILLSWFSIVYREIFLKGSGQKIEVKEVNKKPLLIVAFFKGIYDGIYYFFYWATSKIVGENKVVYNDFRQREINYNDTYVFGNKDKISKPKIAASNVRQIGFNVNKSDNQNNNQTNPNKTPQNTLSKTPKNTLQSTVLPTDLDTNNPTTNNSTNVQRYTVAVNHSDNQKQTTQNGNVRNCKNCNKPFTYKHWNARYCSDKCRIDSWEKRTGATLKKKSKKR